MKSKALLPLLLLALTACDDNGISIPRLEFGGLNGNVSKTKESKYDAVEKFGEIVPDDLEEVTITEYDEDGNQTKYALYDEDGDRIYKIESAYEKNQIVSEVVYLKYENQKIISRVVDRKKNYIKWLSNEGMDDESTLELIFEGLTYKGVNLDGETVFEMQYDKTGRMIDRKSYSKGEVISRTSQEFDKDGNLVKVTEYYSSDTPSVVTFSYPEFDKKDNWITRYTWEDGEVVSVTKREITYR